MSYSPLFQKLLKARGISPETAEGFLRPKYESLNAPDSLPDMAKAVKRIQKAIKNQELILVFGDYDADGVTATAVLVRGLRHLGANVSYDLPERLVDGYGLPKRITETMDLETKLLITVDCGSRDLEIVAELKKRGVDVIITDHHEIGELPKAVAVINPKREDSKYPFRDLAGVGVAFQLVRALAPNTSATGTALTATEVSAASAWTKWLLDLVALGTVCDQVPLKGDNRILVKYGLKVMRQTKWRGLAELIRDAKQLDTYTLAFVVGPKINASGRLESPRKALDLLLSDDSMETSGLAMDLDSLNQKRRQEQQKAVDDVKDILGLEVKQDVVVVKGEWHEGLIGLLASKLVEAYERPAFVWTIAASSAPATGTALTATEAKLAADVKIKCSARSFGEFSCAGVIGHLQDLGLIEKGGGHAAAGGMSAKLINFEMIEKAILEYYRGLKLTNQLQYLRTQPDVTVENVTELSMEFWQEMQDLAPFGQGHLEPLFRVRGTLFEKRLMGKQKEHVGLRIGDKERRDFRLCAWGAAEKLSHLRDLQEYNFDFRLTVSDFGGAHTEGRLVDVAPVDLPLET
ncbi:single-stranded-DNA-specific exonuclease RecJ [Candidatus Saccharibacteria bacterium]|nr:single-stranded-DNA-specific exonuclease RecJ [Candidatus Saccharibacteria bacterium]